MSSYSPKPLFPSGIKILSIFLTDFIPEADGNVTVTFEANFSEQLTNIKKNLIVYAFKDYQWS